MIRVVKHNIFVILLTAACVFAALIALAPSASADTQVNIDNSIKCGSNINGLEGGGCNASVSGSGNRLESLIRTIINVFSVIVGFVSVIMIIIGGFRYIISGGDSGNVSGAKNTILYAIVGLVLVAFAQVIVQFVLQRTI